MQRFVALALLSVVCGASLPLRNVFPSAPGNYVPNVCAINFETLGYRCGRDTIGVKFSCSDYALVGEFSSTGSGAACMIQNACGVLGTSRTPSFGNHILAIVFFGSCPQV